MSHLATNSSDFLKKIDGFPKLTDDEQMELAKKWSDFNDRDAAEKLVLTNLYLVVKIAKKYRQKYNFDENDLIQEGVIGLMHAVKKFDYKLKVPLRIYAVRWIKTYMDRWINRTWSLLKTSTEKIQNEFISKSEEGNENLNNLRNYQSIDNDEFIIKSTALPEDNLILSDRENKCVEAVKTLTKCLNDRERTVIEGRILSDEKKTLSELAKELNVSAQRVKQIETKAMEKMKIVAADITEVSN